MHTTLGAEDYAASAIERLLEQKERPANVEAWLRKTINNQYIDRFRKIEARGGVSHREWSDERWEEEMISHAFGSPSVMVAIKDQVDQVLKVLNEKEKELLILAAAGFDNHQIAVYAGYRTNKIVATRIAQIALKVRTEVEKISSSKHSK
ncbi:RpoE DNA-directed RNA polymerase specialized sigma subunit, sigma24 homolog [Candidatus Nanopelagicaceae bacterium]